MVALRDRVLRGKMEGSGWPPDDKPPGRDGFLHVPVPPKKDMEQMGKVGKRARENAALKSFREDLKRLTNERSITCGRCGAQFIAVSMNEPPQFPGVTHCYSCGLEIPVTPEMAIYLNAQALTATAADGVA